MIGNASARSVSLFLSLLFPLSLTLARFLALSISMAVSLHCGVYSVDQHRPKMRTIHGNQSSQQPEAN